MVHEGQGLALGFKPGDDLLVSMPSLMTLRATRRRIGSVLLGHVDQPQPPSPICCEQFVVADAVAGFLGEGEGSGGDLDGGARRRRKGFRGGLSAPGPSSDGVEGEPAAPGVPDRIVRRPGGGLFEEVVGGLGGQEEGFDALPELIIAGAGLEQGNQHVVRAATNIAPPRRWIHHARKEYS